MTARDEHSEPADPNCACRTCAAYADYLDREQQYLILSRRSRPTVSTVEELRAFPKGSRAVLLGREGQAYLLVVNGMWFGAGRSDALDLAEIHLPATVLYMSGESALGITVGGERNE